MASISFPGYGTVMTREYSETPVQNVYRTEMEAGYAKQAQRSNTNLVQMTIKYLFTDAEFATFKTWFYTTSASGSLFFDWVSPVDGVTRDTRIVNGQISSTPVDPQMSHWFVSMTFESYQ